MNVPLLLSTFGLLFVMELGDKTQLAVLSLTAQTRRGPLVFLGAISALALVTLLGVAVGATVVEVVPEEWIRRVAAVAFIVLGVYLFWSSFRGEEDEDADVKPAPARPFKVLAVTFGLIFVAEMGDKTQLSAVVMTAQTGRPVEVFLGGALGLVAATLLGVLAGGIISRWVPEEWVTRGAAVLFVGIGLVLLVASL